MAPRALIRPLALLALIGLLSACQDQQARQQSAQLAARLAQLQDQTSLLGAQLKTLQGHNTDLTKQLQQLQTQVAQLSLAIPQNSQGDSSGNQTSGTVGSSTLGDSTPGNSTAAGSTTGSSVSGESVSGGSTNTSGSGAEQARQYSATVHAAYLARMSEDPMYTPEGLVAEAGNCLKADAVGDRSFGARPQGLSSCKVTPDGENDVRVTVNSGGQTFVNGARQKR